jgi:hypothetical protein
MDTEGMAVEEIENNPAVEQGANQDGLASQGIEASKEGLLLRVSCQNLASGSEGKDQGQQERLWEIRVTPSTSAAAVCR